MTSVLLAQKLISVQLSKREFEKIRCKKACVMDKCKKIIDQLKTTIEGQGTQKVCRLCLKTGAKCIFDTEEDFDFILTIRNILGIEVNRNDGKPQHVCNSCESTLRDAEKLKQTAEIAQWRLQQELDMVSCASPDFDVDVDVQTHTQSGSFVEKEGKIKRQWSCQKCKRTFDVQAEFVEHEKQPTCRRSNCYICETCGMEFKTLTRLKRHRLIHTGSLLHACTVCPYRARTAYAITVHARAHSGLRPLSCELCRRTFPSASNLAAHRRTHMPPTYKCMHCPKAFRFKQVLKNHIASQHNTAKPHVCETCGKAFSTRKMICRHERRVHNRPKMRSGILPTYLRLQEEAGT